MRPACRSRAADRGDWTVNDPATGLAAAAVTPSSGAGPAQTFALQYSSSTQGAADLRTTWVWFHETFAASAAGSCLLYADLHAQMLHLPDDAGQVWQSAALGGAGTLENGQCAVSLDGAGTTADAMRSR